MSNTTHIMIVKTNRFGMRLLYFIKITNGDEYKFWLSPLAIDSLVYIIYYK